MKNTVPPPTHSIVDICKEISQPRRHTCTLQAFSWQFDPQWISCWTESTVWNQHCWCDMKPTSSFDICIQCAQLGSIITKIRWIRGNLCCRETLQRLWRRAAIKNWHFLCSKLFDLNMWAREKGSVSHWNRQSGYRTKVSLISGILDKEELLPLVMFHYESRRIKEHTDTSCKPVNFQTCASWIQCLCVIMCQTRSTTTHLLPNRIHLVQIKTCLTVVMQSFAL